MADNIEKKVLIDVKILDNFVTAKKNADEARKALNDYIKSGEVNEQQQRELAQSVAKTNNEFKEAKTQLEAASKSQDIFAAAGNKANKTMGEMQRELKALKNTPLDFGNPAQVREVEQAMANLTAEIDDYKVKIKGMDTGEVWNNMASGIEVVVAGASGLSNGLKAIGIESPVLEQLQNSTTELIATVQAMAVVTEYLDQRKLSLLKTNIATLYSENNLKVAKLLGINVTAAQTAAEEAAIIIKSRSSIASKAAAAAQWLWNSAILANPLMWMVVALVAVIGGVIALTKALGDSDKKFEKVNASIKATTKTLSDFDEQTKLNEERLKANGKTDLEIWNYKKQRYAEELALNRKRYAELKNAGRELSDDEKQQLADSAKFVRDSAKAKYQIETEGIVIKKKLSDEALELDKKNQEASVKANEAANEKKKKANEKKAEDDKKAQEKKADADAKELDKRLKKEANALEKQKQQLADKQQNELIDLSKTFSNNVKKAQNAQEYLALEKQYEKEKFDIAQKYREADFNAGIATLTTQLNFENLTADQKIEIEKSIADAKAKYATESADIAIKANEDVVTSTKESAEKQKEIEQQLAEKKQELYSQLQTTIQDISSGIFERRAQELDEETKKVTESYDAQIAAADGNDKKQSDLEVQKQKRLGELEKQKRKQIREQAIVEKAFQAFQIGISTTKSVGDISLKTAEITAASALNPLLIPSIAISGAQIPVALGIGALQLASVLAAPLPKAARGKVFRGNSHANGGIPVEVEGDEIILTKGVYRNPIYRQIASMLNQAAGGVSFTGASSGNIFASGGAISNYQFATDGGYTARSNSSDVLTKDDIEKAMEKAVSKLKVYASIEDIRKGDKNYTNIEDRGNY